MTPESPESLPGSPQIDAGVVKRLRTFAEATNEAWEPGSLHRDAADEIERLSEALSCIVASGAYPEAAIAQEALEAT